MKFSDGMEFDTSIPNLKMTKRWDGYYVYGKGTLIPCKDREEAIQRIKEDKEYTENKIQKEKDKYERACL